jgi:predicted transposase YdaD
VYNDAVANAEGLQQIENRPYFIGRLTEAQLEEERRKAEEKGEKKGEKKNALKAAQKMLSEGLDPTLISRCVDLDMETIRSLNTR